MKKVFLTILCTVLVIVIVFTVYIYSGAFDATQVKPHGPIMEKIIGITLQHSIEKGVKKIVVPPLGDTSMIALGMSHYNEMCVVCHGGPGVDPSELTKGLYPQPPVLYKMDMPQSDFAFWIIKYGIKMTGMPAFAPTHSDNEIWAMTAFIINKMNDMSPSDYQKQVKKMPE